MATQVPVVNESIPGKSWSVYWELGDIPKTTSASSHTTNTTFTCGEKSYEVEFSLFDNGCSLTLDFETPKDDEKKSDSMVTVCHKGIKQEGLLRNNLQLWWFFGKTQNSNLVTVFQEQYPDSSCNFQITIEIPGDEYEAKGLKFINKHLSKLMGNESLADIKFVFKDDQVPAHSAIVGASSPVFAAMFEGGRFQEGQTRTVNIEDIDSQVFRKLLQFLYTGSSGSSKNDSSDALQALFLAADKYQVDALKEICEECLILKLAIQNVLHLLEWAHLYGAEKLKEASVTFIVEERFEVWKLKEWAELGRNYPDLFYLACDRMVHYPCDCE